MSAVIENHHDDHHHGPAKGITRWLYTTNHKDIGTLYLWFSFAMFLIGGAMAMIIRAELFQPGMQIVEPEFYNQMITLHGLIMIFFINIPVLYGGLGNYLIPIYILAPEISFPRINCLSLLILPFSYNYLLISLYTEFTSRNGFRMDPYHRLDIGATYTPKKKKKFESSWNFSLSCTPLRAVLITLKVKSILY